MKANRFVTIKGPFRSAILYFTTNQLTLHSSSPGSRQMATKTPKPSMISTLIGWAILCGLLWWGGSTLYGQWWKPQQDLRHSDTWIATPCNLTVAKVVNVPKKNNIVEYTPTVSYEYSVNQKAYQSNRFWFGAKMTNDQSLAEDAIKPFKDGGNFECFVNPTSPSEAVLVRKVIPIQRYWLVFAIIALVVGGIMLLSHISYLISSIFGAVRGQTDSERNIERAMANSACPVESGEPDEPLIVQAAESRVAVAIGLWIFALVWNGITWAVAYSMFVNHAAWPSFIFVAFFLFIGFAILGLSFYSTLQIFNPRPILACSQRDIFPGSEFELSWMFRGNPSKIQHLEVILEGIEEVKYRQGTTTRTEKATFFQQKLIDSPDQARIAQGFELVSIPTATMHTFKSTNNSFTWQIRVNGKIAMWPDISDRFEIIVLTPKADAAP